MPSSQQSGFTFPMIQQGPQGHVNYAHNNSNKLIEDSILQIVMTAPGQRMWNPQFGCRVRTKQFDPSSTSAVPVIQNLVVEAITLWEPRVKVTASSVQVTFGTDGTTQIVIAYTVVNPDSTTGTNGFVNVTI